MNDRRIKAAVAAFLMILTIALSSTFLVREADHDCLGEDCPVCMTMDRCVTLLRLVSRASLLAAVLFVACYLIQRRAVNPVGPIAIRTPVQERVRMNN